MMNLIKAEQAILNGIYGAIAWLILDFGFVLQEHGEKIFSVLISSPELLAGAAIVVACIAGLFYKSRIAATVLFLFFFLPLVIRAVQGVFPSTMMLIFSFILLYIFLTAVLGAFSWHQLKLLEQDPNGPDSENR